MPVTATTAAIVGSVAAIGGLGMSVVGAFSSAAQQRQAAQMQQQAYAEQAEAARRNQQVAEENAKATEVAGAYAEKQARLKAMKLEGAQKAGFAKAGVLPEGTPLDVTAETARLEEMDILATRYNYATQASRYRSQAGFYGFEGERQDRLANAPLPNYMQGAYLKAGTSLLTTGASLANTWSLGRSTYNPNIPGSGWGRF